MIEVPAAVAIADQLAREASFFSIGSNDLIQYVMAADRTNSRVAPMADPFQPAVLRMIRQTVEAGRAAGIDVALCGELAADPVATPLLLGLGLEEFSVSAPLIPELKRAISSIRVCRKAEGVGARGPRHGFVPVGEAVAPAQRSESRTSQRSLDVVLVGRQLGKSLGTSASGAREVIHGSTSISPRSIIRAITRGNWWWLLRARP